MDKIYYPCCKENGCNGLLKIKINNNFSIDYECDIKENHKGKNIYFKTFERFYLKEDEIDMCSKCHIDLPYNFIFKCNICGNNYCNSCFQFDIHIKDNLKNLDLLLSSCPKHKVNLTHYCIHCDLNLCIFCIKEDEEHENHNIQNLLEYIPSTTQIIDLINKINDKEKSNNELIDKINNWKNKIISKTEELKQNLKDEIDFLKKMVLNFSQYFIDYNYISNFYKIDNYIKELNNEYLEQFRNSFDFEKETNSLLDFFCSNNKVSEKVVITENIKFESINFSLINHVVKKLNDNLFFINYNQNVVLASYNQIKNTLPIKIRLNENFYDKIYSVSFSKNKKQIYACILNNKAVKIFDICENEIKINNYKIVDQPKKANSHFNKCIQWEYNNYLVTADNLYIKLWSEPIFLRSNNYQNVTTLEINEITSDLLLIENGIFVSSHPGNKTINFIYFNNIPFYIYKQTIIPKIDSINSQNCLFLYKDYIIVNCNKGIAIILKKTKQLIQYIEDDYKILNRKEICIDNEENIYILNNKFGDNIIINILKEIDGIFEITRRIKAIDKLYDNIRLFCLYKGEIFFIWKKEDLFFSKKLKPTY